MKKIYLSLIALLLAVANPVFAGNPDRQGAAGATELLMNPWARSVGLNSLNVSMVSGVESIRVNAAGLARTKGTMVQGSHMIYLSGTGITLNAGGFAQKVGENGTLGVELMAVSFGDIVNTTVQFPDGDGTFFSPSFFNMGLSYAHSFEEKVFVGATLRLISQSIPTVSAFGFAIDAGVQYVTGEEDNFKLGISLRNIGSPMKFGGTGLEGIRETVQDGINVTYSFDKQAATFEMPSLLHMGFSYDFYAGFKHRITPMLNFTSNSFSRDILGLGLEYAFSENIMLRGAYREELGSASFVDIPNSIFTGLSAGFTVAAPLKKGTGKKLYVDYGYLATNTFNGCHTIGLTFDL
jgi:opacity protein-like surface antigen